MTFKNLLTLAIVVSFFSCSKQTPPPCIDAEYDLLFTIEAGQTYCFDDDTELEIVSLINEFCPCDVVCVHGGWMSIDMKWTLPSGEAIDYLYNGSPENGPLPDGLTVIFDNEDFTFAEPCTEAVPSPEIIEARITVSKQ